MRNDFGKLTMALAIALILFGVATAQPILRLSAENWEMPVDDPLPQVARSSFFIENQGDAQLEWSIEVEELMRPDEAPIWSQWFHIDLSQGFIEPGHVAMVSFAIEPARLVGGQYVLDLIITHNDPNQPEVAFNVTAAITGVPLLTVLPSVVNFNEAFEAVETGREYVLPLRLCNDGSDDLMIDDITLESEHFLMDRFEESIILQPGETRDWMVRFQAAEVGEYAAVIRFISNMPDAPEEGIGIPLQAVIPAGDRVSRNSGSVVITGLSITAISPNPLNGVGTIHFQVPTASLAKLGLYTVDGRLISELGQSNLARGEHTLQWDAAGVPSGNYFVKLNTPEGETSLPMTILK